MPPSMKKIDFQNVGPPANYDGNLYPQEFDHEEMVKAMEEERENFGEESMKRHQEELHQKFQGVHYRVLIFGT